MIAIGLDHRWRVALLGEFELPVPVADVWRSAGGFDAFTTRDPFHSRIRVEGGVIQRGTRLTIEHSYAGWRTVRHGRVLRWEEGVGYAFSDISRRGVRHGFPHLYSYRFTGVDGTTTRVTLSVRGKWTATWLPRWAVRLWLGWVMLMAVNMMRNHLLWARVRSEAAASGGAKR